MQPLHPHGCIIAAPQSGSGKTLVTLGLLRAMTQDGLKVKSAKVGPDYIDPAFHSRASGTPCVNLDQWAMGDQMVRHLSGGEGFYLVEGVMGLFDGADSGVGSTADIAALLGLPIVLVVNASAQSHSVAALLHGFNTFRRDVELAGVIFNKAGSARHETLLRQAASKVGLSCFGVLPRTDDLVIPSRHLGLVQASEHTTLDAFMEKAADFIRQHIDLTTLYRLQRTPPAALTSSKKNHLLPPLGQRIALASDEAFSFMYPHIIDGFRQQGAEIIPFSPLHDEAPDPLADAVFLPGGYPELHAEKLANNRHFLTSLHALKGKALIYGECGGFMVLGESLIDGEGRTHKMAGLLPVVTSFATRKRHLGYRRFTHNSALPWPKTLRGHEFHYSTLMNKPAAPPLFSVENSLGETLPSLGVASGLTIGSYGHIIAAEEAN